MISPQNVKKLKWRNARWSGWTQGCFSEKRDICERRFVYCLVLFHLIGLLITFLLVSRVRPPPPPVRPSWMTSSGGRVQTAALRLDWSLWTWRARWALPPPSSSPTHVGNRTRFQWRSEPTIRIPAIAMKKEGRENDDAQMDSKLFLKTEFSSERKCVCLLQHPFILFWGLETYFVTNVYQRPKINPVHSHWTTIHSRLYWKYICSKNLPAWLILSVPVHRYQPELLVMHTAWSHLFPNTCDDRHDSRPLTWTQDKRSFWICGSLFY